MIFNLRPFYTEDKGLFELATLRKHLYFSSNVALNLIKYLLRFCHGKLAFSVLSQKVFRGLSLTFICTYITITTRIKKLINDFIISIAV